MNIDHLTWTRHGLPSNSQTVKLRPLINELFTRIFPQGVSQMVTVATRSWTNQKDSGLDHLYSNKPQKLSEIQTRSCAGSDHKFIFVVRYSKALKKSARYVTKRSYKNFRPEQFLNEVRSIKWWDLYQCIDVNEAVRIFNKKITDILDKLAPIKTIQIRSKYAPWLSSATKTLMKQRDDVQDNARMTNKSED